MSSMSCQNLRSARQNESTARGFPRYCAAAQARSLEGTVQTNIIVKKILKAQKVNLFCDPKIFLRDPQFEKPCYRRNKLLELIKNS